MNPISFALRRPKTVVVLLLVLALAGVSVVRPAAVDDWLRVRGVELPIRRMSVDIFPALNLPVIYVCQPYGGMDPAQMEGLLTNYYEYHFLYISGIHHVESRNVQGTALMKLVFHPGTNMAQAMAETINYVNRSRAMMPPGTVPPFVMRFDTGSVPVGYLVLSSATRTIAEIQDLALFRVRPMFSSLPGVSAPPPFGGSARTVVIRANPDRLRAYGLSPDEIITALTRGNAIAPSGNVRVGDLYPAVPTNAMARDLSDLGRIPVRTGDRTVYLRDVGVIEDSADLTTGYALVNGRRAVYILATKRADASTMDVTGQIRRALPSMQKELPDDIRVSFEFDQSPYVTRAISSLSTEGVLGAALTGLMVLLFLRDWRSALVVVLNIPLALLFAVTGLWLTGQTINLMTLGGLALSVGILVDEATVEIENIHTQLRRTGSVSLAVWRGNQQTALPRLLALLCMLAVFLPTFFMQGAPRELFAPLALAVMFSMTGSYLLSSTLVPILCVWLLRPVLTAGVETAGAELGGGLFSGLLRRVAGGMIRLRWLVVPLYVVVSLTVAIRALQHAGLEIFPGTDSGEFRLRLRAPDGTHIEATEQYAVRVLKAIEREAGEGNVSLSLGYAGTVPASFPINSVYQFSRGPEEAILRVAFRAGANLRTEVLKRRLREQFGEEFPQLRFSFEPADIVSEVMSFGAAAPVEAAVRGGSVAENRDYAVRLQAELQKEPVLRDVQIVQSLEYPTVEVKIDRERAGLAGATADQISRSVLAATSSSRFVVPSYWPDPKSGIGYQVQVEIPQPALKSAADLGGIPVLKNADGAVLLRDVAELSTGKMPGEFDRYNMKRELSLTANIDGADLGSAAVRVDAAIRRVQQQDDALKDEAERAGVQPKPGRITCELRGQIPPLRQMVSGLGTGLVLAILAIFLMLSANFQSFRLALAAVTTIPAVLAGSSLMLWGTGTTLNIQSFIGMIMSLGVSMANAILLISFAEQHRRAGACVSGSGAAVGGGVSARVSAEEALLGRSRAILMTSSAMLAGMLPLALGWGSAGSGTAPLGLAVLGGLGAATAASLLVLPAAYCCLSPRAASASLHPGDPDSKHFAGTEL
ncbi:MAG: efflux RND transporter permease subunit [Planctomycetaceae bacterium]